MEWGVVQANSNHSGSRKLKSQ